MSWLVLVLSGALEAVWATALGRTEGFTRVAPTVVFLVGIVGSMLGLAYAMRSLPIGTAYAVWVGIGAALTAGYAICGPVRSRCRRCGSSCWQASSAASSA
ncbi:MAG TPA: SMR family transporter [Geodermatophilus sp.]|nr:SMR family transporter [Geodermatophilus sp.]